MGWEEGLGLGDPHRFWLAWRVDGVPRPDLFESIEAFDNTIRKHSTLAYKSPAQFEQIP